MAWLWQATDRQSDKKRDVSLPAFQQELFSPNFGSGKDLKCDKNDVRVNQWSIIIINNTINFPNFQFPNQLTWWTWQGGRPPRAGRGPSLRPGWASRSEFGGTASCQLSSFAAGLQVHLVSLRLAGNILIEDRLINIFLGFSNVESVYYPLCLISLTRSNNLPQGFIQKTLEVFLIMRSTTSPTIVSYNDNGRSEYRPW